MRLRRLFWVLLIGLALVYWLRPGGVAIEPGSVLVLEIEGRYVEAAEPPLLTRLLGESPRPLASLLSELAKAERDERLGGVVLRIRSLDVGWGKAQEIRSAIARLAEKGPPTVAHLELESLSANLEYYVASAAPKLFVGPATRAPLIGLAGEYLFLGGLFEKLGVELEVERIGRYKTAADTLSAHEMSEAHREMANALLDSIDGQFVRDIAASRSLPEAAVRRAIDAAPVEPRELESFGLIDGVHSFDAVVEQAGGEPVVRAEVYRGVDPASVGFEPVATFALVYGSGNVVTGRGRMSPSGATVLASETVSEALIEAAEDPKIDAILFRIDSPGGSAMASDLIWHAAQKVRAKGKPLVASFSDVAASGGYYVAAGADAIVAPPGSITGSIGVFVLRPMVAGLLEKLGVGVTSLTRGAHADLQIASKPLTPGTRARLRREVESIYELFVERVAAGRPLEPGEVDAVAQGRVWTGEQAAQRGLVDDLGGLRAAVARAKRLAGVAPEADVALVPYPQPQNLAEQFSEMFRQVAILARPVGPLEEWTLRLEPWIAAASERRPAALLPFSIRIR